MRDGKRAFARRLLLGGSMVALAVWVGGAVRAQAPGWWAKRDVIVLGQAADDFAILNQGQLKQFALAALAELEDVLSDGAGAELNALVNKWTVRDANGVRVPIADARSDDYVPVNLGQLKAVAMPFRARLQAAGMQLTNPFGTVDPDDYALANVGQAKQLFNIDPSLTQVEELQIIQGQGGPVLSWKSSDPDDRFNVFALDESSDFNGLVEISSDISQNSVQLSEEVAATFHSFAVQRKRNGTWGMLKFAIQKLQALGVYRDPVPADLSADTDGDGIPDSRDAWPTDPDYAPPRTAVPSFALLPLRGDIQWVALNERGNLAGNKDGGAYFWRNGEAILIRDGATVLAMNDSDQVLLEYEREATGSEYDLEVVRAVYAGDQARTAGLFNGVPGDQDPDFYPASYSGPQERNPFEPDPLRVRVCAVWSPSEGLRELSLPCDVTVNGLWPRWTNGSRLLTIAGRWIDNRGTVYGEAIIALVRGWGSDEPVGASPVLVGQGADGFGGELVQWNEQERWARGWGINRWFTSSNHWGPSEPLVPSGRGIGMSRERWYVGVTSQGQQLIASWNTQSSELRYEVNGFPIDAGRYLNGIFNGTTPGADPILYEATGQWGETLWVSCDGDWKPKPVGTGDVCWGRFGSVASRLQHFEADLPAGWSCTPLAQTDSGLALVSAIRVDENGDQDPSVMPVQALLIPVTPVAPEVFMFSGHESDLLWLTAAPGSQLQCEWRFKDGAPALGAFGVEGAGAWGDSIKGTHVAFRAGTDAAPNIRGHARGQAPGKTVIELRVAGQKVWEKNIEVIEIIPRKSWGALPPVVSQMEGMESLQSVTVHHSASNEFGAPAVLQIQRKHMGLGSIWSRHESWADIGYHFVLDPSNPDYSAPVLLFEGRSLEGFSLPGGHWTKGSAVRLKNGLAGVNICVLGHYHVKQEAFDRVRARRLEKALSAIFLRYGVPAQCLRTHRGIAQLPPEEEATVCPGWQVILSLLPDEMRKSIQENLQ